MPPDSTAVRPAPDEFLPPPFAGSREFPPETIEPAAKPTMVPAVARPEAKKAVPKAAKTRAVSVQAEDGTEDEAIEAIADPDAGFMYVLDQTAGPGIERTHAMQHAGGLIKEYTFKNGEAKRLPFEVALRFLKNEGFIRVDSEGERLAFRRAPRRPEELEAGEQFKLTLDETVARFDELTTESLIIRAAMLPESEVVVKKGPRAAVIAFIQDHYAKIRVLNTVDDAKEDAARGLEDGFTPPPVGDEAFY